jgi:ABC-2 type transport system permease protein
LIPPLFHKTLRDHWRGYLGWNVGLISLVSILLSVYPTVRSSAGAMSSFLANYPEAMLKIFRISDYASGPGYLSSELLSFMGPLIFIAIGISWGASASAQEEENRTADLLLTLPISRSKILLTKIAAAAFAQVVLGFVLYLSLVVGARLVHLSIGSAKLVAASVACSLLGIMFNAVATILGSAWGKKSIALGGAIALALAGFLLYSMAPLVGTFDRVKTFNPFQWTLGSEPLTRGFNSGGITVTVLIVIGIYAGSLSLFRQRDIST